MKKVFLNIFYALVLILSPVEAIAVYDPPHNEASGVYCAGCHGKSLELFDTQGNSIGSPFWDKEITADETYNAICHRCHITEPNAAESYGGESAPIVVSHAPGGTEIRCTVCHNNHEQEQIYPGRYNQGEFFIATGTAASIDPYDSVNKTTSVNYSALVSSGNWADLNNLIMKSGTNRGAMLVPDMSDTSSRWPVYKIAAIDTDPDNNPATPEGIITVKGEVSSASNLGIFYGQLIRYIMRTDGGTRFVEFYDRTGANGFVRNSAPYGICQVCHTKTDHWRNDGSLAGVGVHVGMDNTTNCSQCHGHTDGFKASCDSCHGYAPIDTDTLVWNPDTTGSVTAGVHAEHTVNQGYACEVCHYDSAGFGSTHNDEVSQAVTMGFVPPNGIPQGGTYDGQSGVDYDRTTTSPETTVSNPGSGAKTCSGLYCHGNFAGSGKNAAPVWDNPATGACGTCHDSSSGAHSDHITIHGFDCSLCHYDTADGTSVAADTTTHVNYATDWRFDPTDIRTSTATYSSSNDGSKSPPSTTYSSCGTLYCHSSVQGAADPVEDSPIYQNPSWSSNMAGCDDCHKAGAHRDPPFMDSGSHYAHVQYRFTQPGNCQACHYLDKGGLLCTPCHTPHGSILSRKDNHVDGNIDVDFLATIAGGSAAYSGDSIPQTAYGSCANTYCHSVGDTNVSSGQLPAAYSGSIYTQPEWGGDSLGCNGCHGRSTTDGMPDYTNGGTGAEDANSHPQHVADNEVGCQECHYDTTTDGTTIADKTVHVDGVNTDVVFTANLNPDATYNEPAAKTCANTYCHSDGTTVSTGYFVHEIPVNTSPEWDGSTPDPQADGFACNNCHAYGPDYDLYDPKANSHVRHQFLGCESCHYTTTTNGSTITNHTNHIDSQYDVSPSPTYHRNGSDHANTFDYVFDPGGGTCSNISCHGGLISGEKKWGNVSLTPSSFNYNYNDQGDYGITITVGSPTCFPDPDSITCPTPYTYHWEFSDGYTETTTSNTIHYEFGAPGPHTATLTQVAANGLNGTRTSGPINPNPPPPPVPEYYPEATIVSGRTVDVTITTTDDFGRIYVYFNGSTQTIDPGDSLSVQYTYPSAGTREIRVLVYDPGHVEYDYYWDIWPASQTCDTCSTLKVTVP